MKRVFLCCAVLLACLMAVASPAVSLAVPATPTLVSPANDAVVTGTTVTFEWGSVVGAVSYRIIVSTSTNVLDTTKYKCNVAGTDTTHVDSGYPDNGTKYYWWVWAYASDGSQSAWAQVSANGRTFTTSIGTYASVSITAPGALSLGTFKGEEWNITYSATSGSVEVTPGTSKLTDWVVTAKAATPNMKAGTIALKEYLLIGWDGINYKIANGGDGMVNGTAGPYSGTLTLSGSTPTKDFDFYGKQWVHTDDLPGDYTIAITFTATCTA